MGFRELFTEWAVGWKQRNVERLADRFEQYFGDWSDKKLKRLFKEADLQLDKFPTPNKLKELAIELNLWKESRPQPKGCPLCSYTGFVSVTTPEGREIVVTCKCEKGRFLQKASEEAERPWTFVEKLLNKEGYQFDWGAMCWGCKHFKDGVCELDGKEKERNQPACSKYIPQEVKREISWDMKTISKLHGKEDEEYPF